MVEFNAKTILNATINLKLFFYLKKKIEFKKKNKAFFNKKIN